MRKILVVTPLLLILPLLVGVTGAGARGAAVVDAAGKDFTPATVKISAGEKVKWNDESGVHTVTFDTGSFDKPLDSSHPTVSRKFSKPGTYRYHCEFHEDKGMKGKVVVR